MSAYIIVDLTPVNIEKMAVYSAQAAKTLAALDDKLGKGSINPAKKWCKTKPVNASPFP